MPIQVCSKETLLTLCTALKNLILIRLNYISLFSISLVGLKSLPFIGAKEERRKKIDLVTSHW